MSKKEKVLEWISQALARGYCSDRNSKKVLDPDLIADMAKEVYDEGIRQKTHYLEILILLAVFWWLFTEWMK